MTSLPRILIIDDQYGGVRADGRNREREGLCRSIGLRDVTGDVQTAQIDAPVAEAVFCRAQVVENGRVHNDAHSALVSARGGWREWPRWALVFVDMEFKTGPIGPDGESPRVPPNGHEDGYFGLEILDVLRKDSALHDIPIVVLSAMAREPIERKFADQGVFDFIDKAHLSRNSLQRLLEDYGLLESESLIGHSVPFLKCLREARRRARIGNDNILLLGKLGSGKELLARYIHDCSPRSNQAYVTVFTQGVPETLVDDRLFGHERGAFDGARSTQLGAAEEANNGTLFIDEFGDISAAVQTKLLRLLDKNIREIQRLGARPGEVRKLDLQIVLATNHIGILEDNGFRRDLLSRAGISEAIRIPSLKERTEDIPLLAEHFVRKYERAFRDRFGAERREIGPEVAAALQGVKWAGNVRDLERVIEAAIYTYPKLRVLSVSHLRLPVNADADFAAQQYDLVQSSQPTGDPQEFLADVLQRCEALEFSSAPSDRVKWAGMLPQAQAVLARVCTRLLKAALEVKRNPTTDNPIGDIQPQAAVQFAMGDDSISAPEAYSKILKIVSFDKSVETESKVDPILGPAFEKAVAKRRKQGGRRNKQGQRDE